MSDEISIDIKCDTKELEKTLELLKEIRKQKEMIRELEELAEKARKEFKPYEQPRIIPWSYNPCDNCPYKAGPPTWTYKITTGTF